VPRVHLGDRQNLLDQTQEVPARRSDALELLSLSVVDRTANLVFEKPDVAEHDTERRAELVRHRRQEARLGPVRRLRFLSRGVGGRVERFGALGRIRRILARRLRAGGRLLRPDTRVASLAVQTCVVDRHGAATAEVFRQEQAGVVVGTLSVRDERDGAQRPRAGAHRHHQERPGAELAQQIPVLAVGQLVDGVARGDDDELGLQRADDPRCADQIVLVRWMRVVVIPRDLLLRGVGVDHRDASDGAVRLDNVDHAPRAEVWQREAGRRLQRGLKVE
jgi:hypothetical protein